MIWGIKYHGCDDIWWNKVFLWYQAKKGKYLWIHSVSFEKFKAGINGKLLYLNYLELSKIKFKDNDKQGIYILVLILKFQFLFNII